MSIVCPGFDEWRQRGLDGHGGDVFQLRVRVVGNEHAELLEHVLECLDRERRLARLVARSVETDDEAVADELVAAHAGDRRDILDAFRVRAARGRAEHRERRDSAAPRATPTRRAPVRTAFKTGTTAS